MEIIPLTKAYTDETGKNPFAEEKTPFSVQYVEWLETRVYEAQKRKRKAPAKKAVEPWRKSFDEYKKKVIEEVASIVKTPEKMAELQRMVPEGYDARETLRKSLREYWLTEDGWIKKRQNKATPDWWKTCRNIVRQNFNLVKAVEKEETVSVAG